MLVILHWRNLLITFDFKAVEIRVGLQSKQNSTEGAFYSAADSASLST